MAAWLADVAGRTAVRASEEVWSRCHDGWPGLVALRLTFPHVAGRRARSLLQIQRLDRARRTRRRHLSSPTASRCCGSVWVSAQQTPSSPLEGLTPPPLLHLFPPTSNEQSCKSFTHRLLATAIDGTSEERQSLLVAGSLEEVIAAAKLVSPVYVIETRGWRTRWGVCCAARKEKRRECGGGVLVLPLCCVTLIAPPPTLWAGWTT